MTGLDNLNGYYDVTLKQARLALLQSQSGFRFKRLDVAERETLEACFADERPERVVHLAARVGVRYSVENPAAYVDANLVGFANVLEGCRHAGVEHLVFASSSSVYGANRTVPFSVHDNVDHPVSLYAATKKANELLAHSYSALYGLPVTGLRFFTVYGPWGRPDMAPFLFTKAILAGQPIDLFNGGNMRRDFTFVDDIAEGVVRVLDRPPRSDSGWGAAPDAATSFAPHRIFNIGYGRPVELRRFVALLESCLGRHTPHNLLPPQPGDMTATWAEVDDLAAVIDFRPSIPLETGLPRFVAWYRAYYG